MGQTYARAGQELGGVEKAPETPETSGRHSIAKSPAWGGEIWKISRYGVAKRGPNFHEARKVPCAPSCRAGRRSTGDCQCPVQWKIGEEEQHTAIRGWK